MRAIFFASVVCSLAAMASAQSTVPVGQSSCYLLIAAMRNPELLQPGVALYIEGLVSGVEMADQTVRDMRDRLIDICIDNPLKSIATAITESVATED